jgi:hypothetical protein
LGNNEKKENIYKNEKIQQREKLKSTATMNSFYFSLKRSVDTGWVCPAFSFNLWFTEIYLCVPVVVSAGFLYIVASPFSLLL